MITAILIALVLTVGGVIADAIRRTTPSYPHVPQETALIWVCVDCYFAHHGSDEHELGREFAIEPLCLVDDNTEVTAGMLWEEHDDQCPNRLAGAWVDECECETITFTWSWCHGCGSTLGGERHALTLWWTPKKEMAA